jgi:F-type H+-transporting ATPase subunit delta
LDIAQKNNQADEVLKDIQLIWLYWQREEKIKHFLANPNFTIEEKKQFIKDSFSTLFSDIFLNFLYLLIKKNRLDYLAEIGEEYRKLYYELKGIVEVRVVLAHSLTKLSLNKLEDRIRALIHKEIKLNVEINPEILGGVSVYFKDQLIDGSLKHSLKLLKENLLAVKVS